MPIHERVRSYSFSVTEVDRIDLQKIFLAHADANILLIANAVFIKQKFLDRFDGYGPRIAGEVLRPIWGFPATNMRPISPNGTLIFELVNPWSLIATEWRARLMRNTDQVTTLFQIEQALDYKSKITVNVTVME